MESNNNNPINVKKAEMWFKIQQQYLQGSIEEQAALDSCIKYNHEFADAYAEKSVSYNKRGNHAVGFQYLNKAVELEPKVHLGYRGFVKLYMMRDYEGALEDYLRLDTLTPNFQDAPWGEDIYKVIGLTYLQLQEYELSKKYLDKSIKTISEKDGEDWVDSETFLYRAIVSYIQKDYDTAISYCDTLLKHNPQYPEAHFYKAKSLINMNKRDEAKKELLLSMQEFKDNNARKSPYYEVPFQLYMSDLEDLSHKLNL
ncbi:MAG: tetratricopeptide repeat protein [Bacteroidota bacterium]